MAQVTSSTTTPRQVPQDYDRNSSVVMENVGKVTEMNREFDMAFWQAQDASARFRAAWEQVEFYYSLKGLPKDELRLQRYVEALREKSGIGILPQELKNGTSKNF